MAEGPLFVRRCTKCREVKPLADFYKHREMEGGYLRQCKQCVKVRVRQHRNDNLYSIREKDRLRAKLPVSQKRRNEYAKRYAAENPERRLAHVTTSNAIRDGRLVKKPCEFCGTDKDIEAHHYDYARPLDVAWLCKPCHRRFHALERMTTYRDDKAA